jgi:hypothetical protein
VDRCVSGKGVKCWNDMKAKEFMMMRAFRLFTVKNFAEPENYDRIVSSNI